jgi:hypothetical protein
MVNKFIFFFYDKKDSTTIIYIYTHKQICVTYNEKHVEKNNSESETYASPLGVTPFLFNDQFNE